MAKIAIIGASFAGLPAAFQLRRDLGPGHDITVMDKSDTFTFLPSLIWLPFGRRTPEQITLPTRRVLESNGIEFIHEEVLRVEPENKVVATASSRIPYDKLLLAAGPQLEFSAVPGLGPEGFTQSICTLNHALRAREAWEDFLKNPGPVVVGAAQRAGFLSAAYEFAGNLERRLRELSLRGKVPVTFITPEPFLGHMGVGDGNRTRALLEGFFRRAGIDWVIESLIGEVTPGEVRFTQGALRRASERGDVWTNLQGKSLPFQYAMIMPPLLGSELVRRSGLGNQDGFIVVDEYFRHKRHPDVFAAGVSVAVTPPEPSLLACAVPKTGYISQVMAKTAARNIAASLEGRPMRPGPVLKLGGKSVLDTGERGLILFMRDLYAPKPGRRRLLLPGRWAHWGKVLFEKYYLWKTRRGRA